MIIIYEHIYYSLFKSSIEKRTYSCGVRPIRDSKRLLWGTIKYYDLDLKFFRNQINI